MVLAFTTVSLIASLVMGLLIYRISTRYEEHTQRDNLAVSARSYVAQMDDRLGRMDAILYYILSDPAMLDAITMLGVASAPGKEIPDWYVAEAKRVLSVGISTEYIMQNSYRTVFFNQGGYFTSSAVKQSDDFTQNQRLVESFSLEEIPYLEPVARGEGHSVITGGHRDFWGAYGDVAVYSLMKAPRGYAMGYIEVENRLDSLRQLETSDPDIRFAILINGDELLYASDPEIPSEETLVRTSARLDTEDMLTEEGYAFAKAVSDSFDLTVLTCKSLQLITQGRNRIFQLSVLAAFAVFALSQISIAIWSSLLVRPVRQLQEIVENTSIENLQDQKQIEQIDRISENRNADEFAGLARSYQAMTARLDKAVRNEKRASMLQLQAQFDTLQTQVNPHFIYNVLNIISSRAVMADDEVICEMCGCLGSMLRYSTNNKTRYASVAEELEYLHSYFYLLSARYEDRLVTHVDVDEGIKRQMIPKMTLQQIAENSVKHGFHETDVHMELTVTGREETDGWYITVRDNGSGVSEEKLEEIRSRLVRVRENLRDMSLSTEAEIGGIGLTNTYARCLLLFGDDLVFELGNSREGSGFEVKVGARRGTE